MAQNIQQHIYLPIPSLRTVPKNPSGQERLELIISNVEKNHRQVQANIIAVAKAELDRDQASTSSRNRADGDSSDAMDISPPSSPTKPLNPEATSLLLTSLEAPYSPSGRDPYQSTRTTLPKPPPHIRQSTPPPHIQLAKQTLEAVEAYNDHASHLSEHYAQCLQRRNREPVKPHRPAKKAETGALWGQMPNDPPRAPGQQQQQAGRGVHASPRNHMSPRNASPRDAVVTDPRLVGRR